MGVALGKHGTNSRIGKRSKRAGQQSIKNMCGVVFANLPTKIGKRTYRIVLRPSTGPKAWGDESIFGVGKGKTRSAAFHKALADLAYNDRFGSVA